VNGELAYAGEDTGKCLEDTSNVISRVHITGIQACDHWVKPGLLLRESERQAIAMYASVKE
jgi:hypothetical protein